ncbi:CTP synthase 1-like isoform X1 [Loxodonta africana]|uniref:CTP synthase 1-like isoform X1 n=1 Tax=Loxodonta africana TaxID=9785 RepID=UPI0030D4FD6B
MRQALNPVDEGGLEPQVCVIELGGTVGDIESMPFTEASVNSNSKSKERTFVFCNILVSLVPEDQMETFGKEKLQLRESGLKPS